MDDDIKTDNPTYPALNFLVRYGDWVAIVVGVVPVLAGGIASGMGMSIMFGIAGLVAGAFLYLMMRSFVELVRVIVDMLLPK
jgi:hypothetical protein